MAIRGDVRRILFIKPSSLGDVVHAIPTFRLLKQRYPQARVSWLVKRQWADIPRRVAGVDEVIPVAGGLSGWLGEVPRLRAAGFDLAVDLQGLFRSGIMARLSGAPVRIGFANGREGSPWFYTERVPVPVAPLHAVDRYRLVAAALGADTTGPPDWAFEIPPDDRAAVVTLLARHGLTSVPWIAVNASARWPTKRWPSESFATTADRLQESGVGRVVFIGGPDERAEAEALCGSMRTPAVNLAGDTPVGLLPALLDRASVLLTNDSGPMHVAAAVGTPVVALFGPTSAALTGPYGRRHRVVERGVPCRPCFSRTCRNAVERECLRLIDPETVVDAVRDQMAGRAAR